MYLQKGKGHIGPWLIHPLPQNIDVVEHYFGTFIIDKGVVTLALARRTPPHRDGVWNRIGHEQCPGSGKVSIPGICFLVRIRWEHIWKICGRLGELVYSGGRQVTQDDDGGIQDPEELKTVPKEHGPYGPSHHKYNRRRGRICGIWWEKGWPDVNRNGDGGWERRTGTS